MQNDSDFSEHLGFYRIDSDTCAVLRENKTLILDVLKGVLDEFYEHIADYEAMSRFFSSSNHMSQAKSRQIQHWELISSGSFDQTYFASVIRGGETHHRIGLDTRSYIGGYSFLLSRVNQEIARKIRTGPLGKGNLERLAELQAAITKAAMFDMHIAIGVYLDAGEKKRRETLEDLAAKFNTSVGGIVDAVASSAESLRQASETVSAATEETSSQAVAVSAAAEQATANVRSVASATEELAASIQEISRQAADSHQMTEEAVRGTSMTNTKVEALAETAQKVGDIVSLISDIADQTNLLALNATIEAARAGEAGRGFAVVASEVKALAGQTANATAEISQQIGLIQSATEEAVLSIGQITEIIDKINTTGTAIASAVRQQDSATQEISRNVHEAFQGTQAVSENITGVSKATEDAGTTAAHVLSSANGLSTQSDQLRAEVAKFMETMRSA
ncbi:globin-coupled sensor protein [Roseibium aggregatum]|uniref:Globin-coupled sensor protein n=1 Tax=Roseibium aggregatum TaxID=187304 RepID=A0A926S5K1_9HYPH|nr:globin-coupled sensor protein [Roseibium aggregatum]MBD1547553.1 globin-coupled sensor protein [Roseibium aggregatum]